jgi:hypothetical protein
MWENLQPFLVAHKKGVGIFGDSITFAGSLILSCEALFKKTERVSIGRKRKLIEHTPYLKSRSGESVTNEQIENKWVDLWLFLSKAGILTLTLGFLALLLGRIFAE